LKTQKISLTETLPKINQTIAYRIRYHEELWVQKTR